MARITLPHSGWTPRRHQAKAWNALRNPKVRTAVLAWHRRAGKDDVALHDSMMRIAERPGNYWHMLPVQEQARKALWEAVNPRTGKIRWHEAFPEEMIQHVDNQAMLIKFKNGATWQLLGSDNYNSLVGTTPVHIVMSEAALANPNAFNFFRPILLENNGTSLHISSTRGKNHFYNQFNNLQGRDTAFVERLSAYDTNVFTPQQLAEELRDLVAENGEIIGNTLFKQEYLSDWNAASAGAIFAKSMNFMAENDRLVPIPYDARFPVNTAWDLGVNDETVILFFQQVGAQERMIDWYAGTDLGIDTFAEVLLGKPYIYRYHIGPHDVGAREWGSNAQTRMQIAENFGIKFERMPRMPKAESIAATDMLMRRLWVNVIEKENKEVTDDCEFVMNYLNDYRFKYNRITRQYLNIPEHNAASNYADALMQYALWCTGKVHVQENRSDEMARRTQMHDNMRLSDILRGKRNRPRNGFA